MVFPLEVPIRKCLSVWVSVCGQCKGLKKRSYGDYEGIAAWKPHSDHFDKKRTPEFVCEILTMIDSDPGNSIRSLARDMGVSEFLIRQLVHEDICYFLHKMRKSHFFHMP